MCVWGDLFYYLQLIIYKLNIACERYGMGVKKMNYGRHRTDIKLECENTEHVDSVKCQCYKDILKTL